MPYAVGTSNRFLYDGLDRVVQDCVVRVAAGLNRTVLRLGYRYEVHGLLQQVTSYSSATVGFGTVVDDLQRTYNAFQQVDAEFPLSGYRVSYGYADGSANTIRPLSRACGRTVTYGYGTASGLNDALSRIAQLQFLTAPDVVSASYDYLGAGRIVQAQYAEPSLELTYVKQGTEPVGDAGDQYTGLDRFGRLVDNRWLNAGASDVDRVQFGYDAASNRLWRLNASAGATGQDEAYRYDGLYQLETLQRGTLNTGHTGINGTPAWEEDFAYDETGNWQNYRTEVEGAAMLDQPRTQNAANEVTALSGSAALLGYDPAGNMVRSPQQEDWSSAYDLTYDAWNRLCRVCSGGATLATYGYDGLSRRVSKTTASKQVTSVYSIDWQILREMHNSPAGEQIHVHDFIWGLRALDDLICRTEVSHVDQLALYALRDGLHVTSISAQDGTISERYGYDAFGETNVMAPNFAPRSGTEFAWTVRFCSYYWDEESELYQVRNRYLHPAMGRWMRRDPIGLNGGSNQYRYVSNAPTWTSDALGLQGDPTFGALPPGLESDGFPLGLEKPPGTDDLTKILCGCGGGGGPGGGGPGGGGPGGGGPGGGGPGGGGNPHDPNNWRDLSQGGTKSARSSALTQSGGANDVSDISSNLLIAGVAPFGSGLKMLDQSLNALTKASDLASQFPIGNPIHEALSTEMETLGSDILEVADISFTSSGSLTGFGAFGLIGTGAELSVGAIVGLGAVVAGAGVAVGYGLNHIPTIHGNGRVWNDVFTDWVYATGFFGPKSP